MKDVLITGASSGIGKSTAELFHKKGWRVFALGRSQEKLQQLKNKLGNNCEIIVCDITQPSDIQKMIATLKEKTSNISALVNNAGVYKPALFTKETDEHWMEHFQSNLMGPIRVTRAVWGQLVANKGCVTNVSSTLGLRPIPMAGAYSALKSALNNWTQTLALEAAAEGVRVNSICPGLVDTPIHSYHGSNKPEHQQILARLQGLQPLGRIGQPEDIAQAIYFSCSLEASWMTGALIPVDGGVSLTTRDP